MGEELEEEYARFALNLPLRPRRILPAVSEEIKNLIDSLRRGEFEDPTERIGLLGAALREQAAPVSLLLSLLRAPQTSLRMAGIEGCFQRPEAELADHLTSLARDPEIKVRQKLPRVLASLDHTLGREPLLLLHRDNEAWIRAAAVAAASGRPEFLETHMELLGSDPCWTVRMPAAGSIAMNSAPETGTALIRALNDSDPDVARCCAQALEERLGTGAAGKGEALLPAEAACVIKAEQAVKNLGSGTFPRLLSLLSARASALVDPEALARFGTDLTALAEAGVLPRGFCVEEQCEALVKLMRRDRWRSLALLGASGAGKSAIVNELVYDLARPENGGWRVLRVSPSDFLAGTHYIGEWETKLRDLVESIKKPRRVLIYVPALSDLSATGSTAKSDSNVATALAPYLEEGSVMVLGESTPEEFERGLGRHPSLQRLFDRVLVPEASAGQTRQILAALRESERIAISDEVLGSLLDVAEQFLSHVSRPGNAVALLRSVSQATKHLSRPVGDRDILDCLSRSTGVPADLLDDSIPLSQTELKAFFERRIIGQPEAVEAVLDVVTLVKAGLTDPQKPFGVLLFVGPTGVGKTELARALGEYIFGSANRLLRLDMSEFAGSEGFMRLIGSANENGLLTDAVRQHPFSVVLMDEIEKSHINIFDLCLQIFDAGRLTDGRGRTVDFRRTIVILTSNIGASAPGTTLGFQARAEAASADVDKDRTFRELTRFFRPEFLNRLDRIVQFRPLSLEAAEQIARREIDLVLRRSGIQRRGLSVEIDPAVLSLLVREGYSPHFGARPLKRTVERLVLLPLARTISSGAAASGTLLHLRGNDGLVEVSVIQPPKPVPPPAPRLARLANQPFAAKCREMLERWSGLEPGVRLLAERKSELLSHTKAPDFYQDSAGRQATYDEIHKLDQFLSLSDGLGKALRGLLDRLELHPPSVNEQPELRERLDQLDAELEQVRFIAGSEDARDLGDALLSLTLVERRGNPTGAVEALAGMYQALAKRRRMSSEILGEIIGEKQDAAWLLVSGLGAYALLRNESGLHQLGRRTRSKQSRTGREVVLEDREIIRVVALPGGAEPDKRFRQATKSKITALKPAHSRLVEKADLRLSLFHEPTLRSLELWAGGPRGTALDRGLFVLHALVEATAQGLHKGPDAIVRHYDFGISPRVKDSRSGRSTTLVERVLKGNLDAFLTPRS